MSRRLPVSTASARVTFKGFPGVFEVLTYSLR